MGHQKEAGTRTARGSFKKWLYLTVSQGSDALSRPYYDDCAGLFKEWWKEVAVYQIARKVVEGAGDWAGDLHHADSSSGAIHVTSEYGI